MGDKMGMVRVEDQGESSSLVIGYDPGGNNAHGLAELEVKNGRVIRLFTRTFCTTHDVVLFLENLEIVSALGVDTLTCWSTGRGGWRPADRWLRQQYPEVRNSVVTPNGLFGSMGLNGMAVLISARKRFDNLFITETHPKVLYWQIARARYDYIASRDQMDQVLASWLGVEVAPKNEHEWDAAISAFAALQGSEGRWLNDLHRMKTDISERLIEPCGETHYVWPE